MNNVEKLINALNFDLKFNFNPWVKFIKLPWAKNRV